MKYQDTIDWLFGLKADGIKFGLENTRELLRRMGHPHKTFKSVHVGGTNGKGSVCSMLASVLQEEGWKVGLYTSPHIVDFSERIKVNGTPIPEKEFLSLAEEIRGHYKDMRGEGKQLTFFELTTVMTFEYFRRRGVDLAVIEVGMGGRLDATNTITPECSVITRMGIEHTHYLGDTIEEIAYEKAGIIKPGIPVVTVHDGPAYRVVRDRALELGSPLLTVGQDIKFSLISSTLDGLRVSFPEEDITLSSPLCGAYQAENMALAVGCLKTLNENGYHISKDSLTRGIASTDWPARLDIISHEPRVIMDVTHTAEGAEATAVELQCLVDGKIILVIGILNDKDVNGMAKSFCRISSVAIATAPETDRSLSSTKLTSVLSEYCAEVETVERVGEAVKRALDIANKEDTILVTGSLYTIGEAKRWWDSHQTD